MIEWVGSSVMIPPNRGSWDRHMKNDEEEVDGMRQGFWGWVISGVCLAGAKLDAGAAVGAGRIP